VGDRDPTAVERDEQRGAVRAAAISGSPAVTAVSFFSKPVKPSAPAWAGAAHGQGERARERGNRGRESHRSGSDRGAGAIGRPPLDDVAGQPSW